MGVDRKYEKNAVPTGVREFRSVISAKSDDMIFGCSVCGRRRIFGEKITGGPENKSPLLHCHNIRIHKEPKLTIHYHDPDYISPVLQ